VHFLVLLKVFEKGVGKMSTLSLNPARGLRIPSDILYRDRENQVQNRQDNCKGYWSYFTQRFWTPVKDLGVSLRNNFYLPWYKDKLEDHLKINERLAEKTVCELTNASNSVPGKFVSEEIALFQTYFSIRDVKVRVEGDISLIFTVRLFESKKPVNGKKLQLILFSYNGNHEEELGKERRWEPITLDELSKGPLLVLKAFQNNGIKVDSLITTSLGNVVYDSFNNASARSLGKVIPTTLVLNRGFTSTKKVANQLFSFPLNYLLYGAAKLTGWDANPEQGLLTFLKDNGQGKEKTPYQVVVIESRNDFYFSGSGSFASDYHNKLLATGARVFRASFYTHLFHPRSHHAIPLEYLTNNVATKIFANSSELSFTDGENVSSMLAKNIFLSGDQKVHTCFFIAGNDVTLHVSTVRDVFGLLKEFVREGQKMESDALDDTQEWVG
jgi:hypothetical protein